MTPATDHPTSEPQQPAVIARGRRSDRPGRGAEEKKAIRGEIRQVKDSIAEPPKQIASQTANLKSEGCL